MAVAATPPAAEMEAEHVSLPGPSQVATRAQAAGATAPLVVDESTPLETGGGMFSKLRKRVNDVQSGLTALSVSPKVSRWRQSPRAARQDVGVSCWNVAQLYDTLRHADRRD